MNNYLVKVSLLDPYPKENIYRTDGSNFPSAIGKALRNWRKDYKGRKIKQITIKVEKL